MSSSLARVPEPAPALKLFDLSLGTFVEAQLVTKMSSEKFEILESCWAASKREFKEAGMFAEGFPENDLWNWEDKSQSPLARQSLFVGIEVAGEIQGMVMVAAEPRPSLRSDGQGKCVLYVEYLESAPWNIRAYAGDKLRYKSVGTSLLRVVSDMSLDAGCEGRIALHSLKQSERFYQKLGFTNLGFDPEENCAYLEADGH